MVVVDDDPIFRQLMLQRLSKLSAEVTEAEDGAAAFHILRSTHFDLALVDLEMPGFDGVSLIQCVRGHPSTRHIPIVVITSRSDGAALQNAMAAGATAYLTKPLQWTAFASSVEFLLRLSQAARQAEAELARQQALALHALTSARDELHALARHCQSATGCQDVAPRLSDLAGRLDAITRKADLGATATEPRVDHKASDREARLPPLPKLSGAAHPPMEQLPTLPADPVMARPLWR